MGNIRANSLVAALLGCTAFGCGTLSDHGVGPCPRPQTGRIYGGVRQDFEAITSDTATVASASFSVIDLPFSALFDTILLPQAISAALSESRQTPRVEDNK